MKMYNFLKRSRRNRNCKVVFTAKSSVDSCFMLQQLEARVLYDAAIGAEVASVITNATATHTADVDVIAVHEYSSAAVHHLVTEQAVTDTHPINSQIVDHAADANTAVAANHPVDKVTDYINALSSNNSTIQNSYYSFDKTLVKEVIFVDNNVHNYVDLLKGVDLNKLISGQLEIVMLQDHASGVHQIANYLDQFDHQIDTVHVVSHGTAGKIYLGNDIVTDANLGNYKADFAGWGQGLANQADVLFYGCSIAANGAAGQKFVDDLHNSIHADIAASSDITSSSSLGGNWVLEVTNGTITAKSAFNASVQQNYHDLLAPITVSNFTDIVNGDTSSITNLINHNGGDGISLREAIIAANNTPGADIINFNGLNFNGDSINLSSSLSITGDLTIDGTTLANYSTIDSLVGANTHVPQIINGVFIFSPSDSSPALNISTASTVHISGLSFSGLNGTIITGGNSDSTYQYNNFYATLASGQPYIRISTNNIDISYNLMYSDVSTVGTGVLIIDGQTSRVHNNVILGTANAVIVTGIASNINITSNYSDTTGAAIDLGADGVTPNDYLDADGGPNNRQNSPVLNATYEYTGNSNPSYHINGTLNSAANTNYRIDYYSNGYNTNIDGSSINFNYGQYLGSQTVTTDGSGNVGLNYTYTGSILPAGASITATASRVVSVISNVFETSEFSGSVPVTNIVGSTLTVTNTNDIVNGDTSSITNLINNNGGDGISLREAIIAANNTPGADTINFSVADQVTLTSQLSINEDLTINGTTAPGYSTSPGPNNSSGHYVLPNPTFTMLTLGNFVGPDINISNTAIVHLSGLGLNGHGNNGGISGGGPGSTFQYNNLSAPVNTLTVSSDNIDISNNNIGGSFNSGNGILVTGGQNINIHENLFNNLGHGVAVTGSANQVNITNNTFFTLGIPIDLGNNGVTANDPLDTDTGPNHLQNTPILTSAAEQTISGVNRYVIGGTLNSEANTSYRIEYYSSSEDPSGGVYFPKFLGSETVTTDGSGNVNLNYIYTGTAANLAGPFITATASKVISANIFETSEFSSSVTLTDTIPGNFYLSSVSNPIGATNKITATPAGLVLSGTITEPSVTFTTFNIRNILYATSNINSIVATGTPVIDSINGTWTYTLNTTLPVGAYRIEAVGTDFNSSQQFNAEVGANTFLIIPAVDNSAPNQLGIVTVDPYLANGLSDVSLSGTSSLSTTSRVIVAVPNMPGAQYLELTTTGYLASSPSNTWSDFGTHFPTPTLPYSAGKYDTTLYVFGAGGVYDSTVTTGNIILDPLSPTAANFNTIATPIAQSNVATTQFSGTFTENMGTREITLIIADHIDTSNLLAHFNHGDFYRIEIPGNTNFVVSGATQLTGSINISPVSGYTSYVNGTYTIDLGQLNNVLTAPLGGSTTYDIAVIASDLVGHTNVDLFSLTDGVNIFRDAITIYNQVANTSDSTTNSNLTNALTTTIDNNIISNSTDSTILTNSYTDNGVIISSQSLADNTTEDNNGSGDLIGGSGDNNALGNSGEDNAASADNSGTTDAPVDAAATAQTNADATAATADTSSSTNASISTTDSSSSSASNSSSTTTDTAGNTSGSSSNDASSSGATQSISDFVNNTVDAVSNTVNDSVDYATKNQNVAAVTVAAGAAPALASGLSAASTTATISSAASSSVQAASVASNVTTQAANVSQIATRPTAHMTPKLGGRAFSNSAGSKGGRSASPNSAEDGGPAEKCKCAVCLALRTTGVHIV